MSKLKEATRFIQNSIFRVLKKILRQISPTYRAVLRNERILTDTFLILQDLRRENMPLTSGERLVAEDISEIDTDHRKRYEFVKSLIKDGDEVLDIACGTGYGSYMMSENNNASFTGVDIATGAIEHANKHFKRDNVEFICCRAEEFQPKKKFDLIVSFETIEHLEHDRDFIESITKHLKQGGLLICSTPNEINIPHNVWKHKFHYRHYTPRQMSKILRKSGCLKIENIYTQRESDDYELTKSPLGLYTVHLARKI